MLEELIEHYHFLLFVNSSSRNCELLEGL